MRQNFNSVPPGGAGGRDDPDTEHIFRVDGVMIDLRQNPNYRFAGDGGIDIRETDVISMDELKSKIDKSIPTIRELIAKGLPVYEAGSPGKPYRFYLPDIGDWFRREKARRMRADAERKRKADEELGFLLNDHAAVTQSGAGLSLDEKKKAIEFELKWQQAAKARGELVKADEVMLLLTRVFSEIRDRIRLIPDDLQRRIGLEEEHVDLATEVIDDVLTTAEKQVIEILTGETQQRKETA